MGLLIIGNLIKPNFFKISLIQKKIQCDRPINYTHDSHHTFPISQNFNRTHVKKNMLVGFKV